MGIEEVCRHLISKILLLAGGSKAKEACGSVNVCVILEAVIEDAIHAVREQQELGRGETGETGDGGSGAAKS